MVELRRWLLNSSSRMSLAGGLLLTAAAGCQSTRDYAANAGSSSQWSTPTVLEAEPAPSVADVKPTPVAPYEEVSETTDSDSEPTVVVPGPEALSITGKPAPAPSAEVSNAEKPARRRKPRKLETVTVDDVAPAPEVAGPEELPATTATDVTEPTIPSDVFADEIPVKVEPTEVSVPDAPTEPTPIATEAPVSLPMPELVAAEPPVPEPATVITEELPAQTAEDSIPGLPADTAITPVQPLIDQNDKPAPDTATEDTEATAPSANLRPLFPEVQPSRSVARSETSSKAGVANATQKQRPLISLPDPMPVTPASSTSSGNDKSSVISAGTPKRAQLIATLDSEVTGIALDGHGNLMVTSDEGLSRISPTGARQDFAVIESPRGFAPLPDGSFVVCDARQRSVLWVDRTGSPIEFLAQRSDGHFLRAPSFLAVDSEGGVYFTDPGYARITAPTGRLHYVSPEGEVNLVSQRLAYPQGVALSADGSKLFVVECQNHRVVQFEILSPGRVGPSGEFTRLVPKTSGDSDDFATGLTVDRSGQVFVARHGMRRVDVINPDGELSRSIAVPDVLASSVALSDDEKSLFVAGAAVNAQWSGLVVRVPVSD
jgi:gluconolactonase